MWTLFELMKKAGKEEIKVRNLKTGEICDAWHLFGSIFAVKDLDGYATFASGTTRKYELIEEDKGMQGGISPEDQKKARELERKRNNEKVVRQLRLQDSLKSRKLPLKITRKPSQFTVIKGGKDDE